METNVANKKIGSKKTKQASSARQEKQEAMQRNGAAAVAALEKYR